MGHQSDPQNISEIKITNGERLSLFPISFGSTKFQKNICIPVRTMRRVTVDQILASGMMSENITGKKTAIIEPMLGI